MGGEGGRETTVRFSSSTRSCMACGRDIKLLNGAASVPHILKNTLERTGFGNNMEQNLLRVAPAAFIASLATTPAHAVQRAKIDVAGGTGTRTGRIRHTQENCTNIEALRFGKACIYAHKSSFREGSMRMARECWTQRESQGTCSRATPGTCTRPWFRHPHVDGAALRDREVMVCVLQVCTQMHICTSVLCDALCDL
jgi:hypothetical protein